MHQAMREGRKKNFIKVQYEISQQGKMENFVNFDALVCGTSAVSIMPELKHNVLRFGYGSKF